jgi:hypothetical protein
MKGKKAPSDDSNKWPQRRFLALNVSECSPLMSLQAII